MKRDNKLYPCDFCDREHFLDTRLKCKTIKRRKEDLENLDMQPIIGFGGRYFITKDGKVYSKRGAKHLVIKKNNKGYLRVGLFKDGKSYGKLVHRLVAATYLPTIDGKTEVNHIDGNKENNNLENLEWCTHAENIAHGLIIKPNRNYNHKPIPTESLSKLHTRTILADSN